MKNHLIIFQKILDGNLSCHFHWPNCTDLPYQKIGFHSKKCGQAAIDYLRLHKWDQTLAPGSPLLEMSLHIIYLSYFRTFYYSLVVTGWVDKYRVSSKSNLGNCNLLKSSILHTMTSLQYTKYFCLSLYYYFILDTAY